MHIILTFDSTHQALATEKALQSAAIPNEVMPTPRSISAYCGLSIKLTADRLPSVQALLQALGIQPNIYREPEQRGGLYTAVDKGVVT